MERIRSTTPTSVNTTRPESKRTASTTGQSVDQTAPPSKRFVADDSKEPLLSDPPLTARAVTFSATDTTPPPRTLVGGKGMFLHLMQQAYIPSPPFTVVDIPLLATLKHFPMPSACLLPYLPDINKLSRGPCTLEQLHTFITTLLNPQQSQWLKGLSGFIASEDFYQQIKNCKTAEEIRQRHLTLQQQSNGTAFIIRSSGMDEDRFDNAQAGRYDSLVHGGGDILKTCLQVLSSAYRPEVCPSGQVKPMALIIQQCIHCQLGGIVVSHSSLQDDTMRVEYAPGQPRGVVSGASGIQPHRYTIRRDDGKSSKSPYHFTQGDIPKQFVLEKTTSGEGCIELEITAPTDAKEPMLADFILKQLECYTQQLENRINSPVNIEFGVDEEQQLFLFQFRPVTQLPGSTQYATVAPSLPLVSGIIVSEGCSNGPALMVSKPASIGLIPSGAVVFADHASDWMLTPDILQHVGGFVFRQGGTNDHVAITLRQAGVPCVLAGSQYSAALTHANADANGQQITLVAGSFVDSSGAYLLNGDQSAYWQAVTMTSGQDMIGSTPTNPAEPPRFIQVDQGFAWLNGQNDRLLDYFHADRIINRCLGPGRSKIVSMSANRTELLLQLDMEIQMLQQDLDLFVSGYQRYLGLASSHQPDTNPPEVEPFIYDLLELEKQWRLLKDSIDNRRTEVIMPLVTGQELPAQPVNFREWLGDCQILQNELQKLTQPYDVSDILSAHDLIYWLHQQFVSALAPVAEASNQGQITEIDEIRTLISILPHGLPKGVSGLLNDSCILVLTKFNVTKLRMLNMADAAFINAGLGIHNYTITMRKQAKGGKGRTLRINISDDFSQNKNNTDLQGKLKCFWFLVQTLRCASIDNNSQPMAISFNEGVGKMTVEYTQINSTLALQTAFVKLVTILSGLTSLDEPINRFNLGNNTDKWSFETLQKKCENGLEDPMNDWTFTHCLVLDAIHGRRMSLNMNHDYTFLDYLNRKYKICMEIARKAQYLTWEIVDPNEIAELRQIFSDATKHLEPDDAARIIKEMLIHMAVESQNVKSYIQILNEEFDLEHDRKLMLFLAHQNPLIFSCLSDRFKDDIEIAKLAVAQNGNLLRHASSRLKNDKSLVTLAVSNYGQALIDASTNLKNDTDVVLAAARNNLYTLDMAGSAIKNNEALLRTIIEEQPPAMLFATESLKNDKGFVLPLLLRDPHYAYAYRHIGDKLKSDPDIQAAVRNKYT